MPQSDQLWYDHHKGVQRNGTVWPLTRKMHELGLMNELRGLLVRGPPGRTAGKTTGGIQRKLNPAFCGIGYNLEGAQLSCA
jgi:hypothetical protein